MSSVGIYGGSFDPIHNGHIRLLQSSFEAFDLDEIIVVPSGNHPFKAGHEHASAEDRYGMTFEAVKNIEGITVSDYEIKKKSLSYMYDTLEYFGEKCGCLPNLIVGGDIVFEFEAWNKAEKYGDVCSLYVAVRPGYNKDKTEDKLRMLKEKYAINYKIAEIEAVDISSTEIRNMLFASDKTCYDKQLSVYIPAEALKYINEHRLYGR